ncbi:hypothetical protein [uncultured Eudoraea sp.]|uniref:hypothetical protein n=1 Tax=uncultured Eudoraea sp. TaxID=1035614 RepID=UPI002636F1B6|nr:hypothetical protein [uncultured Eudoraea sp.]
MIKFFREIILTIFLVGIISCKTNRPDGTLQTETLTQGETEQVDIILKKLYQSFSYGKTEEPNWELMRSVFFEGAQFVSETSAGESPRPQTIEEFISSWQNSIRDSNSPTEKTTEWIIETKTTKIGRLIRVDVVFQASKSNDPSPRKTGLDSLVLANVDGVWKILSFVIHYESKL